MTVEKKSGRLKIKGKNRSLHSTPRRESLSKDPPPRVNDFTIVGIGASAGGLEAFLQLLSKLPAETRVALVLVQHLDPKHASMSVDIFSRATTLHVSEVRDGIYVEPQHVYVIPPNLDLEIKHGVLHLLPRSKESRLHLPINLFFQSLAEDQKSKAIGIVLSGSGSDGTEGLRYIRAEGGITMVQDPASAKFDGMPKSAIASESVDLILTPKEIARELIRIADHSYSVPSLNQVTETTNNQKAPSTNESALSRILISLRNTLDVDFFNYKQSTIQRRIEKRMILKKMHSVDDYAVDLEQDPEELKALYPIGIFIMKRSNWASGRGNVPYCSTGFWVAITKNSGLSGKVCRSKVTCPSAIPSRRPDCVRGVARLISSASRIVVKIGPLRSSKACFSCR